MMFKVFFVLSALCASCVEVSHAGSPPCPCGYQKIHNGCYLFVRNKVTWDQARADCQTRGADMAMPISNFECHRLAALARAHNLHVPWIGVFRRYDGHFVNTCGRKLRFSRWAPGEPNHVGRNEHCGHMYVNGVQQSKWNDAPCHHKFSYICEIKHPRCD